MKLPLPPRLERRLAVYTTLAGAALAAPVIAKADIIFSGPVNINIPSSVGGVYLNVVTGQVGATSAAVPGWDLNPWGTSSLNFFSPTPSPGGGAMIGSGSTYSNCECGALIGPGSAYGSTGTVTINPGTPLNFNSSNNYVGFRFLNEVTGQINYGWAQIALSGSAASQPRAIIAYLYDNSGASVTVGLLTCVPEPSPLMLFGVIAAARSACVNGGGGNGAEWNPPGKAGAQHPGEGLANFVQKNFKISLTPLRRFAKTTPRTETSVNPIPPMSPFNKLTSAPRIDARLAAYATLAGVALAAPAVAKADIVWSGPMSITIPSTTAGVYLNVVTGVFNVCSGRRPRMGCEPI